MAYLPLLQILKYSLDLNLQVPIEAGHLFLDIIPVSQMLSLI